MKIRKARLKDIGEITNLLELLFTQEIEFEFQKELHIKALKKIINNKDIGTIFVVTKEQKVIGCVNILFTISTALGGRVALLEDMIINPLYQNKGIGKKLLLKVFEKLKKKKVKRITLLTDGDNQKGHTFYKFLGFVESTMKVFRQRM
jgi:AraC family transcriptional regulator of adaptative response/methylated-DNA-[protein]-cysteine methyltransferase